jgi:hypothetical protein
MMLGSHQHYAPESVKKSPAYGEYPEKTEEPPE